MRHPSARDVRLTKKELKSSALGDNIYYLLPVFGRVQVDLMKYVQNSPSFNLDSYKLDNVALLFVRGDIKGVEQLGGTAVRVTTNSTGDLRDQSWVKFVVNDGIIEEPVYDGKKFIIRGVTPTSFIMDVELGTKEVGQVGLDLRKGVKHSWCESKDDMPISELFRLQLGSAEDRALIAKYCVQDCELVSRLCEKLSVTVNQLAMGSVCLIPFSFVVLRGQGIRAHSLLGKQCAIEGYLIPFLSAGDDNAEQASYEGAIVLTPTTGVWFDPVSVCDFSSLYPSSIVASNLSHETYVDDPSYTKGLTEGIHYHTIHYENFVYQKTGRGDATVKELNEHCPVTSSTFMLPKTDAEGKIIESSRGVLPRTLMRLLDARKATKRKMAEATDPFQVMLLDALQNSFKVVANSLYGQV
jgi:DNA polymerase elongation subunit (family B)